MKIHSINEKTSEIGKIALWGPVGSGKTWLIHAFSATLLKYSLHDPDFLYELTDTDRHPLDFMIPRNIDPTSILEDTVLHFRRIGKKDTSAHRISSNEHKISIIDNKGDALSTLDDIPTSEGIIDSPNIILLLDVTQSLLHRNQSTILLDPKEYTGMVAKLLQLLAISSPEQRRIAVCLSKSDQLTVKGRETISLIKMLFGSEMADLFLQFRTRPNLSFEFFTVSSVGLLPNKKPNYDISTGFLVDETMWNPYNVEFPFFWFFENIELSRIAKSGNNFLTRLLVNSRLKKYIPYPRPLK